VDSGQPAGSLLALDEITRRLRRDCPWDREQDERSIVPHTVEEAYELADAANSGDDAKMLDELGDVLFQVYFLSLLLEERGQGDLASVAEHCRQKLIRRHPHVFGDAEASDAATVLRNWDQIKRAEPGRGGEEVFHDVPENLPSTLYARKLLRRAASGSDYEHPSPDALVERLRERLGDLDRSFEGIGDLLFDCVALAATLRVDPELALRSSADRFRKGIESSE
jgi:XTP/dITP diphosphohydrolase/tetrapyrrole methylase family protein/MazG family protein/ATP diphosphatase